MEISFDGELFGDEIHGTMDILGKSNEGWSQPDIVRLSFNDCNFVGYRKLTSIVGQNNGIEIVLCQIGTVLGINMADTVCIYSNNNNFDLDAIVSISAAQFPYEQFKCFREMRDELFLELQTGGIPFTPWIKRWEKIRKRKKFFEYGTYDVLAYCDKDYSDTVEFAIQVSNLYCKQHSISLLNFQYDYLKMLLFDIFCGQADRSPSNYGIVINQYSQTAKLAPLFDNATLNKPYMNADQVGLNHVILDRNKLIRVLYNIWNNEILDILNVFLLKKKKF